MIANKSVVYKVVVDDFEFSFTQEQVDAIDMVQKGTRVFNVLKDHKSIEVVVTDADRSAKNQMIEIEGKRFDIKIKDELDQMLDKMGFTIVAGKQIKELKAPMPGLVLEVNVSEGQQVYKGDKILILVAMKMENNITIQADAIIKRIAVKTGEAVDKGQVLIELE
jgi:acetyl/propionyl-CoA carboxylase alpha subunit